MNAALKQSIVRIQVGKSLGTGFIVRSQAGAVDILSALHVVADYSASKGRGAVVWLGASAQITFQNAEIADAPLQDSITHSVHDDWVLLRIAAGGPTGYAPVRLADLEGVVEGRPFSSFGYIAAAPEKGDFLSGKLLAAEQTLITIFCDQAGAQGGIVSGASGGPCAVEGEVIGVLTDALQDRARRAVNGAVYAFPIRSIAAACDLELLPGPQLFEPDVIAALKPLEGEALQKVASSLGVPLIGPDAALRRRVARGLLLTDQDTLRNALVDSKHLLTGLQRVAAMALARNVIHTSAEHVASCVTTGAPKGLATIATDSFTVMLLVARALQSFDKADNTIAWVDSCERSPEAWAKKIRDALMGLAGLAEDEEWGDDELQSELARSTFGKIVAFQYDPYLCPLDLVETYQKAYPLAMLPRDADWVRFPGVQRGYALAPAFASPNAERDVAMDYKRAVRDFKKKG